MSNWPNELNTWLLEHQALVASFSVPLLTLIVTAIVTISQSTQASRNRINDREIQRLVKIAEFRETWLNDLRNELADLISYSLDRGERAPEKSVAFNRSLAKVRLRLNEKEESTAELNDALDEILDYHELAKNKDDPRRGEAQSQLVQAGRKILKAEWDRLRSDLELVDRARMRK